MKLSLASPLACTVVLAIVFAAPAIPARAAGEERAASRASVDWTDPAGFREVRESHGRGMLRGTAWLDTLKTHLERRATRVLPPDRHLEVTFTDIKLAGAFEPWRGPHYDDVRIVKDIYPPRIDLRFVLKSGDGSILAEGERTLRDVGFLTRGMANTSDPLRYERRMLDEWLDREFVRAGSASGS